MCSCENGKFLLCVPTFPKLEDVGNHMILFPTFPSRSGLCIGLVCTAGEEHWVPQAECSLAQLVQLRNKAPKSTVFPSHQ